MVQLCWCLLLLSKLLWSSGVLGVLSNWLFAVVKMHWPVETVGCCLGGWLLWSLWNWMASWLMAFRVAAVISQWHRDGLNDSMRKKGIKPSPTPLPGKLLSLPSKLMVLSAVMQCAWATSMVAKQPFVKPVTWVTALEGVLHSPTPLPLPPPAPDPEPPPSNAAAAADDDPALAERKSVVELSTKNNISWPVMNLRLSLGFHWPCYKQWNCGMTWTSM
jgi:hypothetical protein